MLTHRAVYLAITVLCAVILVQPALAQSTNIVIIGGTTLNMANPCSSSGTSNANVMAWTSGGCLPVSGMPGGMIFSALHPSAVTAAALADPIDTAVLNMASYAMACNAANLSPQAKADLVAFVSGGKKLIIVDSECSSGVNYSWLPYPFTTANPGAMGARGTLTIVEENTLSSNDSTTPSPYYINAAVIGSNTDAVGDMNVMTSFDGNWCVDMSGTNYLNKTGPVQTYANYPTGTDTGLVIYNGLDWDYLTLNYPGSAELRKVWTYELTQPFNPSGLPCRITVVGITLTPATATNPVGTSHTLTATVTDLLGNPQLGVSVEFTVLSGPHAGTLGSVVTDASGVAQVSYTGTAIGTDSIEACFVNDAGEDVCSRTVTKEWTVAQTGWRMTGGGVLQSEDGSFVLRHGFVLNCDATQVPNNLEVNWGKGNKFHLESLDAARCSDNPTIAPDPPTASFDTHTGAGTGRLNGEPGATARWVITDAGEPGKSDTLDLTITDSGGSTVVSISGPLKGGNHQAHE